MTARNQASSNRLVCLLLGFGMSLGVSEPSLGQAEPVRLELSILSATDRATTDERSDATGEDSIRLPHGRPLALRVELRNESADRSIVVPTIDPSMDHIQFEMRMGVAEWRSITVQEWAAAPDNIPGRQTLGPGESVVWELSLEDRLVTKKESGFSTLVERYLFGKLGEYELRASLNFLWPVELQVASNVVSVEVVERRGWPWWVVGLGAAVVGVTVWRCRSRFRLV